MQTPCSFFVRLLPLLLVAMAGCQSPKRVSQPFTSALYSTGSDIEGKRFIAKLGGEALLAAPCWDLKHDQPPLAPGAAKRAAMKALSQTVADMRKWKLEEIGLIQPFDGALGADYWIYQIRFSGPKYKSPFGSDMGSMLNILVLMSGEVIPLEAIHAE